MRLLIVLLLWIAVSVPMSRADCERPGDFDYYVLSLSWSPNWCAIEGDARGSPQCDAGTGLGWVLHGLWPQYHRGWPAFCPTARPPPGRNQTRAMADIMGSSGLAWYQWRKHGSCSGLSARDYFALSRRAYENTRRPAVFRKLGEPVRLPAGVVEEAFVDANPGLEPDMITVTCKPGRIHEVRLCLSMDLDHVPCGPDVVRDCQMKDAHFAPLR